MNEEILELDYHKIVKAIDNLVNNDFMFDMECKLIPEPKEYTQEEAIKMVNLICNIYKLSHLEHCKACRTLEYAKKHKL